MSKSIIKLLTSPVLLLAVGMRAHVRDENG